MTIPKTCTLTAAAVAAFVLAQACAAQGAGQEVAPPAVKLAGAGGTGAGVKLILLKPALRFEDARSVYPIQGADEAEYQRSLREFARATVGTKAEIVEVEKLDPAAAEACGLLALLASRLARGDVNEEAIQALGRLAAIDERYAVLIQFFRLKTGPGRSWDSFTGVITSSMASTLMQAAVVSAKSDKVMWKGEQLVRNKALKPTSAGFQKELTQLYRDFSIQ